MHGVGARTAADHAAARSRGGDRVVSRPAVDGCPVAKGGGVDDVVRRIAGNDGQRRQRIVYQQVLDVGWQAVAAVGSLEQIDPVRALVGILHDRVAGPGVVNVVAGTTRQRHIAGGAVEEDIVQAVSGPARSTHQVQLFHVAREGVADGRPHGVATFVGVLGDRVSRVVDVIPVVPETSAHGVGPGSAVDGVVAGAADDVVVSSPADDVVVPRPAVEDIAVVVSPDAVVSGRADHVVEACEGVPLSITVGPLAGGQVDPHRRSGLVVRDPIGPATAVHVIRAGTAHDVVVAGPAVEDVAVVVSPDAVVSGRAEHVVEACEGVPLSVAVGSLAGGQVD